MGQWVITVAGIAILSVLCDVILPEGKTRKYIKTVVGVVVTVVMLQPIIIFTSNALNGANSNLDDHNTLSVQQSYLDMVEEKQIQLHISTVKDILNARGIVTDDISCNKTSKSINVQVDVHQSAENQTTINNAFRTYFEDYQIIIKWK